MIEMSHLWLVGLLEVGAHVTSVTSVTSYLSMRLYSSSLPVQYSATSTR